MSTVPFVYFAGEPLGVPILKALIEAGMTPALVVCNPDKNAGRGLVLTPPPVKLLAETNNIPVWQPESLKDEVTLRECLSEYELFVVVAYNKILPQWLIELPKYKTINVHPSLLPKLRGASPIRTAIATGARDAIGVSVMLIDAEMDHGPLLAQTAYAIADEAWPPRGSNLDDALAALGGELLVKTIPQYIGGQLTPTPQDHEKATYTTRLQKTDGELLIDPHHLPTGENARVMLEKIRAYEGFPGTYFFYNNLRVKIADATIEHDGLVITSVTPEGKKQQPFSDWLRNQR